MGRYPGKIQRGLHIQIVAAATIDFSLMVTIGE